MPRRSNLRFQEFQVPVHHRLQIAGAQVGNPGPGKIEEFRDLFIEAVGFLDDDLGQTVLRFVAGQALLQQFGSGADDPQGIADLVGHAGGHFPQGRQAFGLVQLALQGPLLLLAPVQDDPRPF